MGAGSRSAVGGHPAVGLFEPGHGVGVVGVGQLGGAAGGDGDDVGIHVSPHTAGGFGGGGGVAEHPHGGEVFGLTGSVCEVEAALNAEGGDGVGARGQEVHRIGEARGAGVFSPLQAT